MGTEKWLDAEMWDSSTECIATLRKRGYRIAVTHIGPDTVFSINQVPESPVDQKWFLCLVGWTQGVR